jgi:hypothetical protein
LHIYNCFTLEILGPNDPEFIKLKSDDDLQSDFSAYKPELLPPIEVNSGLFYLGYNIAD